MREQSTLLGEGKFHVPLHVGHCLEQLQIAIMKDMLRSYFFSSMTVIDVGETDDPVEVDGEISNLISFSNSSGAKLNVGDKVMLSKVRRTFKKGYLPGWTEEIL